jgi:hypothetical protein
LYFSLIGERPPAELAIGENPKLIPASETLAAAESEFATNMLFTYYRMSSDEPGKAKRRRRARDSRVSGVKSLCELARER